VSGLAIDVSVTLHNALKRLDKARVERMLHTAMVSGGQLFANAWKEEMHWKNPTGTYMRSVHVAGYPEKTPDFDPSDPRYKEIPQGPDLLVVQVGTKITDAPYPAYLEYGTSRMPPYPVAGPSFDKTRDVALREVGEAFEELVAKELAK